MTLTRRAFLQTTAATAAVSAVSASENPFHISSNQYSWYSYYRREDRDFTSDWNEGLAAVARSGMDGFEATVTSPDAFSAMSPALKANRLELRSVYVNSSLHEKDQAQQSIEEILTIARVASEHGVQIIVTNPNPIQWGQRIAKSDEHLRTQAQSMNQLGEALGELGIRLAYHFHDVEFLAGAREFHHMMMGTSPERVSLCLDTHWVFRGAENSTVALYDIIRLYADRVAELHLRQSIEGTWSETFGDGDIDYRYVSGLLRDRGIRPLVVLEQAPEEGTPHTMNPIEVHRKSIEYVIDLFNWMA